MNKLLVGLILAVPLSGCFKDEWSGYVYPDKHNLSEHEYIGKFKSLEICREEALDALNNLGSSTRKGDYECGLNCDGSVCDKTER